MKKWDDRTDHPVFLRLNAKIWLKNRHMHKTEPKILAEK